ncbi:MAG: FKBP-type peptidyl-prolyl cis-trans isomerase [Deltaproteobacteria bacterium]|nr:FKBP-type peptidyl-prolyl cis-trans isomerase [Deltaproteobacteria bacterium]
MKCLKGKESDAMSRHISTSTKRGILVRPVAVFVFLSSLILFLAGFGVAASEERPGNLKTEKDKASYLIGTNISKSLLEMKDEINLNTLVAGIRDSFNEKPLRVNQEEAKKIMSNLSERLRKKEEEKYKLSAGEALAKGKRFLEDNKKKEDVVTTKSGLQYVTLRKGQGTAPSETDQVTVHYRGTTIDGAEFDSSYARNTPASFPVKGVIKGWTEALLLMNVGGKYKLFIPSELAYGERGAGQDIGPNEVLIFEVELLKIEQ